MKSIELLSLLGRSGARVFSTYELAQVIGANVPYASLVAHRLVEAGLIRRAERGVYYLPGSDIYAVASNIIYPSYVSLFSAFRYYNITSQMPTTIDIITTRRHKKITDLEGFSVRFTTVDKNRLFGFHRDKENGAFVADVEKAVADALCLNDPPGTYVMEAASNACKNGKFDIGRLNAFLKQMRSKAAARRGEELIKDLMETVEASAIAIKS